MKRLTQYVEETTGCRTKKTCRFSILDDYAIYDDIWNRILLTVIEGVGSKIHSPDIAFTSKKMWRLWKKLLREHGSSWCPYKGDITTWCDVCRKERCYTPNEKYSCRVCSPYIKRCIQCDKKFLSQLNGLSMETKIKVAMSTTADSVVTEDASSISIRRFYLQMYNIDAFKDESLMHTVCKICDTCPYHTWTFKDIQQTFNFGNVADMFPIV